MYAVLDLETTGGKYNEEGITEVAIYKFNGHEIVDQFISLVNPERPIQAFVVGLTGINNKMLTNAPKFYEVAKRIIEITKDCVLVAHNAEFDYRILQLEFDRLGYDYQQKSLCTVELAKDLLPDEPSYSLGKLVRSLGIPLTDRHRANGDALATVKLFKLLLDKDSSKKIIQESVKLNQKKKLDTKLRDLIEEVPSTTGVYYLQNENGRILFIGKSRNMKKRVSQHFTSENKKSRKLQNDVEAVSFEPTGSELLALIKENEEIDKNKPIYNRGPHKRLFKNQISSFKDDAGYIHFQIERADARKAQIGTFSNYQSAKAHLKRAVEEFDLDPEKSGLKIEGEKIRKEESVDTYNKRANAYIASTLFSRKNFVLVERGRTREERAALLIEDGKFKGYGYFNLNHQLSKAILHRILTPIKDSKEVRHIIQSYYRTRKGVKILELASLAE
ncbi:exonuclease domain-containing protein [Flavimarina sp. Hel_I_48]|uniref:exonuclease domain-containing protein n=1 Tax=Flavimarina sp. Hel_I_48 TaxID=1392488 RepID=UPI0004DF16A1|nr:exonuclease domain-containing protein [Flavimarina sp. Hel_I_48]